MKKILGFIAMLFIAVVTTACGSGDPIPEPGVWNDDIYVNESLGIQFQLPRGWESLEGEDLIEVLGMGAKVLSELGSELADDDLLEELEENPLHDLYAINMSTGSNLQVIFQRLPRSARNYSTEEALESMIEEMEESMGSMTVDIRSTATTIGRYEYHSADITVEVIPGVEMYIQFYVRLEGRIVSAIIITSPFIDEFDEILSFFNEPGAARIEIEEPELAEASDLIGTWVWNLDDDYLLIFNEDGTGDRGDDLVEEFEWEIFADVLYLDFDFIASFGVANEEWEATIDGDVLTIESLQAPGMVFSYIRR